MCHISLITRGHVGGKSKILKGNKMQIDKDFLYQDCGAVR